jgi:hypothetical protein
MMVSAVGTLIWLTAVGAAIWLAAHLRSPAAWFSFGVVIRLGMSLAVGALCRTLIHSLAAENPKKVKELQAAFPEDAKKYNVMHARRSHVRAVRRLTP